MPEVKTGLTVRDVMAEFQNCDPDAYVVVVDRHSGYFEVANTIGRSGPDMHGTKNVSITHSRDCHVV